MANAALQPILASVGSVGGTASPTLSGLEGALQTFLRGAPVVNSGGFLVEASANPTAIVGIAHAAGHNLTVAGVANAGAVAPGGILDPSSPNCEFTPVVAGDMLFEISIDKASAQAGAGAVLAQTNMWATYGITKDVVVAGVGGSWYLDVDKAGTNAVYLIAFKDPPGTVNGRVFVQFAANVNALK